jgi:hypothetical protein
LLASTVNSSRRLSTPSPPAADHSLITINPQQTVTVLFDVAVRALNGGSVNFGDTLRSGGELHQ